MSLADKIEGVNWVLAELGLDKCRDVRIGGARLRGISGGELKRLNVANELLSNPSLLILDEPTSGLDSSTALGLIMSLSEMTSKSNRTVIMSIHQPSSQIFAMFDSLILLSNGHIVYQGPSRFAQRYFASLGFHCPIGFNVADFLMDILTDDEVQATLIDAYRSKLRVNEGREYYMEFDSQVLKALGAPSSNDHGDELRHSTDASSVTEKKGDLLNKGDPSSDPRLATESVAVTIPAESVDELVRLYAQKGQYSNQVWVLMQRGFRKDCRGIFTWLAIIQTIAISFICGILWFQSLADFSRTKLQSNLGLLFFTVTHWGFYPMFVSLGSFPEERLVIAKERASKTYGVSAYFLAKTFSELPVHLLNPFIYFVIVYLMSGFPLTAVDCLGTLWVLIISVAVAQSLGVLISTVMTDYQKGAATITVCMLATMLAAGYWVNPVPVWIEWIKWLSYLQYSYTSLVQIYVLTDNRMFFCPEGVTCEGGSDVMTGEQILAMSGYALPFWANMLVLHCMFLVTRAVTYFVLRFSRTLQLN